jgi:hypothetical protein
MPTLLDSALLAGHAYGVLTEVTSPNNTVPLPTGWIPIGQSNDPNTGYMGRAYRNLLTGEIVISYAGTQFESAPDWIEGNLPGAIGDRLGGQILNAARTYLDLIAGPTRHSRSAGASATRTSPCARARTT